MKDAIRRLLNDESAEAALSEIFNRDDVGDGDAQYASDISTFNEVVINAAAKRRGVRPGQMRLSLTLNAMGDPEMAGTQHASAITPLPKKWQGLH
ncbi:hypothetical protein WN56_13830 [Salinivibrio sp. KP-1]|nr:hypothetical protein WN56_13830 [Salinivibrio sp. KP-1]